MIQGPCVLNKWHSIVQYSMYLLHYQECEEQQETAKLAVYDTTIIHIGTLCTILIDRKV